MNLLTENQQHFLVEELLKLYSQKRERNSAYSMRSFSKKIGVSSGALSEIFNKKRKLSHESAKRILSNINYSDDEINQFLSNTKKTKKIDRTFHDLSLDQYQVLSSWHYLALLNLIELPNGNHDPKVLAERLNLPAKKIQDALDRLQRLEMLEFKNGRFFRTYVRYQTTEDIANSAIKKYHSDTLELSEKALRDIEPELRDFSSILLKLNPKHLKKLKEKIRTFQDEISEMVENDDPKEIYHLNMHLYPVTKTKKMDEV